MSPSHSNTADVAVNQQLSLPGDDEDDICPVCESECTCDNKRKFSIGHTSSRVLSGPSTHESFASRRTPKPSPSLKIKLTVPPKLAKSRGSIIKSSHSVPPSSSSGSCLSPRLPATGDFSHSDPRLKNHLLDPSVPKRRGRPPKVVVAAREAAKAALAAVIPNSSQEHVRLDSAAGPSNHGVTPRSHVRPKSVLFKKKMKLPPKSTVRGMTARTPTSRKRIVSDRSYHPQGFSRGVHQIDDDDEDDNNEDNTDDDDDDENTGPLRFPTFISASSSSDSSSSSSSGSDIDSSDSEDAELRVEEESYIVDSEQSKERRNRHYDRTRVIKELFSESDSRQKGRPDHTTNRWEIKRRRKSVTGSEADTDADMDVDTDDNTTEAGDGELEGGSDDDDENADMDEFDRDGRRKLGVSFAGVVTGWSEGEDSSYDADLFFANLDDSDSDSGSTATLANSSMDADGEDGGPDGDQDSGDDLDETMSLMTSAGLDGLSFEISSGWDGQFIFSSGLNDFDVDMATELNPQITAGDTNRLNRPYQPSHNEDLFSSSLMTSDDESLHARHSQDQDVNTDEDYHSYHDGVDLAESDGETTEDELVGNDGLPNARAMMLFRWPVSVISVDPMNTLSPASRSANTSGNGVQSAEDIHTHSSHILDVSTKTIPHAESNEEDRGDTGSDKPLGGRSTPSRRNVLSSSLNSDSRTTPKAPACGFFKVASERTDPLNVAIIDGHHPELPSPYPRTKRPHKHNADRDRSQRRALRDRSLSVSGQSSILGDEILSTPSQCTDFEMFSIETMGLDEVLNAAFLASEPIAADVDQLVGHYEDQGNCGSSSMDDRPEVDAGRHLNSLNRWDRIPMATFRRTRESGGVIPNDDAGTWSSPSTTHSDFYASAIRNSHLHSMIPQTPKGQKGEDSSRHVLRSPLSLNDGDGTQSNIRTVRNFRTLTQGDEQFTRLEKEKKNEKKLRRKMTYKNSKGKGKSNSPQHSPPNHRHQQHHQHHPNSKSRASSSMQRSFFSSSSLPTLNT